MQNAMRRIRESLSAAPYQYFLDNLGKQPLENPEGVLEGDLGDPGRPAIVGRHSRHSPEAFCYDVHSHLMTERMQLLTLTPSIGHE